MRKFAIEYTVVVEAEDLDEAEILSHEIEGGIAGLRYVHAVHVCPYVEDLV